MKTVSLCCLIVQQCTFPSAIVSSEAPLCPMTGWVCQWKLFWIPVEASFKRPTWKSGFSSAMHLVKDQVPQIRVKSSPRLLGCRSLPLRHLGSQRSPRVKLVFGNVLRHHCLRCGHHLNVISFIYSWSVPFQSVWYCRFQLRSSCQATRILSPQVRISALRG